MIGEIDAQAERAFPRPAAELAADPSAIGKLRIFAVIMSLQQC
jgi:hypothetical protein